MKRSRAKLEEIIGILIGLVFWYFWAFIIITMSVEINVSHEIAAWVFMGVLILFLITGHYSLSRNVINEKQRVEDLAGIKSNLIGYFLWLILLISAYLLKIEISSNISLAGGYVITLLIYLCIRNKELKRRDSSPAV